VTPNRTETEIQSHLAARPRALHRFAIFTTAMTLVLLSAGGLVTSHGVGMAVPDWPNTFGYNMFFFPFSQWVGGVFYEHSHRLIASAVGFCTTILVIWLYGTSARLFLRWLGAALTALSLVTLIAIPARWSDSVVLGVCGLGALTSSFVWPRCQPARPWLRRLGFIAFFAVVLQGVLGGLRVVLFKDQIGIFHATLAQVFFALTCALALFTSSWWEKRFGSPWRLTAESAGSQNTVSSSPLAWLCLAATGLILAQLVLGATMRHQHAGLAISDFPLAYGRLWPALDPQSITRYNQQRIEVLDANPITAFQIELQMIHRAVALVIICLVACSAGVARRELGSRHSVAKFTLGWLGLIFVQALLGAATIWSNKAADIATLHVVVGAISLALGSLLSIVLRAETATARRGSPVLARRGTEPAGPFAAPATSGATND
jgi:cytochrome c oxidase assembly protein subunit 15